MSDKSDAKFSIPTALKEAKIGISGGNSIYVADGAVFTVFGTGNIAHISLRPVYVVISGIERVLPTMEATREPVYLQSLYEGVLGVLLTIWLFVAIVMLVQLLIKPYIRG